MGVRPLYRDRIAGFVFSRRGAWTSLSIIALVLAIFLVQTYGKANREGGHDFTSYLLSSRALLNGTDPYQTGSPYLFYYPLFLCVVLIPLTAIPEWMSTFVWFTGNAAALFFSMVLLFQLSADRLSVKHITALIFIPFLVFLNVLQNNLLNGQINFIVLLLCTLFFREHLRSRRFTASVYLSAAIAIKLTPAIFLLYLIGRKDFVTATSVLIGFIVMVFVLPYALSGNLLIDYYAEYATSFLKVKLAAGGVSADGMGFSITSVISGFFPSFSKLLSYLIGAGLSLTPVLVMQHRLRVRRTPAREMIVFFGYLAAMILISPMSETHHLINLFPAVAFLTAGMLLSRSDDLHVGAWLFVVVVILLTAGQFFRIANIAAILACYGSICWMYSKSGEGVDIDTTTTRQSFVGL